MHRSVSFVRLLSNSILSAVLHRYSRAIVHSLLHFHYLPYNLTEGLHSQIQHIKELSQTLLLYPWASHSNRHQVG